MEDVSGPPGSEDRGRTDRPSTQQLAERSRSKKSGRVIAQGFDTFDRSSSLTGSSPYRNIEAKAREVLMGPDSDTDNEISPSGNDDSSNGDSEQDDSGRRGKGKAKRKENDSTQYRGFQTRDELTNQTSFPVSENSVECARFNKSVQQLVACLRRSNTEWVSIDCLGRKWISESEESKIRTTVLVSFSEYPDGAEELRRDLQMAMKDNGLPIEFIQGKVTEYVTDPFGAREPENPLVCGASCAPHGISKAGTVGGFITIRGDPNPGTVYAVTNHHVVAESREDKKEILWVKEENMESHLGLTEQQSEDLADLRLDRYDRRGIHRILKYLGYLKLKESRTYGDDRKRYLRDFVKHALSYWNGCHRDNPIGPGRRATILGLINGQLENFNPSGQRMVHRREYWLAIDTHGLEDFERNIAEDMRYFLTLPCYELQIALRAINTLLELDQDDRITLFKDVILLRRLWRFRPKLSRIIEHPANGDLKSVIGSVNALLSAPGGEAAMPQGDAELLRDQLQELEEHKGSANKLIGTVWASSGIHYYKWTPGSPLRLREDWALIRLFRNDGQEFQNTLSANLLRPGYPEESFTGVRELPSPIRMDVTKRGRTTGLTTGTVNGAPSIINLDGDLTSTFAIVTTPPMKQFFSAKGDSGAWIMDRTGQLVGMMWGGRKVVYPANKKKEKEVIWDDLAGYTSHHLEVEDITYFIPASYIFKRIESSFKKGMKALGQELPDDFEGRVRLFQ